MPTTSPLRQLVKPGEDVQRRLRLVVRRQLGQSVYAQTPPMDHPDGYLLYRLAAAVPEGVTDPETGQGIVAFLRFTDLASIRVREVDDGTELLIPPRSEISKAIADHLTGLQERVERAVLRSASRNIVRSSLIENALNPLEELLATVSFDERVHESVLRANARYLPLLEDLGYVQREDDHYEPGPAMLKFDNRFDQEAITAMLGDIVTEGYTTLVQDHHLQQLVPLVRVANSYFWPSHEAQRPLLLRPADMDLYHRRLYGKRRPRMKLLTYLSKLTSLGILRREDQSFRSEGDMWETFESHAPALA